VGVTGSRGYGKGGTRCGANEDKRLCQNPIRDAFSAVDATRCADFTAPTRDLVENAIHWAEGKGQDRIWARYAILGLIGWANAKHSV